jgi:hypothetical protein
MKSMFLSLFMMLLVLHLSAQVQPYTLTISSARVLHTNLVSLTFAVSTNYIWPYGLPPDTEWQIQTAPCVATTNWINLQTIYWGNYSGSVVVTLPATNTSAFFRVMQTYAPP